MQVYPSEFYEQHREGARRSAREIVPLVVDLLGPRCVIDVGCGLGTWLMVFRQNGVEDVWGVDGDFLDCERLEISRDRFIAHDLRQPFRVDKQFDLVVSLEVAEHLPAECADMFVDSLVSLGPAVLFSAAIPHQGGTHHLNEQWPEYWVQRFEDRGCAVIDCLRKQLWQNERVEWWYAQNMLLFAKRDYLEGRPALKQRAAVTQRSQLSIVHPKRYLEAIHEQQVQQATVEIAATIPPGDTLILVDQDEWGIGELVGGRRRLPFPERDGRYWGLPPDDANAIQELERLRRSGASFIVIAWPAFWWLDYYAKLHDYLRSQFRCVLRNDRLVAFDLRFPSTLQASHKKGVGDLFDRRVVGAFER
jgi:SAM-dependent methyltransferase